MGESDRDDPPVSQPSHSEDLEGGTHLPHGVDVDSLANQADVLEVARDFLNDDAIKAEPRARKVEFLTQKGLNSEQIEELLGPDKSSQTQAKDGPKDLKTIHDSTTQIVKKAESGGISTSTTSIPQAQAPSPAQDAPPIITYPEFLLKPQKPPPLVTFERLLNAGYALAGLSALTYGASKYLVEPMLQSLTDARHDFASAALQDLEKLNDKLESSVSHVPYTASAAALKAQHRDEHYHDDDADSIDSDPTELFHRDIATQTSPSLSRTSSSNALNKNAKQTSIDATDRQTSRLESLHTTLETLVASLNPSSQPFTPDPPSKKLHESIASFQSLLDKLESAYNPFRSDYSSMYTPLSSNSSTARGGGVGTLGKGDNNEAAKFKQEIRGLKGAFLSSRNFPAAPRTQNYTNYGHQ